jgi:hypothetical protein
VIKIGEYTWSHILDVRYVFYVIVIEMLLSLLFHFKLSICVISINFIFQFFHKAVLWTTNFSSLYTIHTLFGSHIPLPVIPDNLYFFRILFVRPHSDAWRLIQTPPTTFYLQLWELNVSFWSRSSADKAFLLRPVSFCYTRYVFSSLRPFLLWYWNRCSVITQLPENPLFSYLITAQSLFY